MIGNCCNEPKIENMDLCLRCKEYCLSKMKPTDTNIAKYYEVSRETLRNYKNGSIGKKRLYEAMKKCFIEDTKRNNSKK